MQKITTFLWFNDDALEAAQFYVSIFGNSGITSTMGPKDRPMGVNFTLEGEEFIALNGGPQYTFTPAISLFVKCRDQAEVDELWQRLLAGGGRESQCGWLRDKYGLSWQVIPKRLGELLGDTDPGRAQRALQAMLQMQKIDVAKLEQAADAA